MPIPIVVSGVLNVFFLRVFIIGSRFKLPNPTGRSQITLPAIKTRVHLVRPTKNQQ